MTCRMNMYRYSVILIPILNCSFMFTHPDLKSSSGFAYISSNTFTMDSINNSRLLKGGVGVFTLVRAFPIVPSLVKAILKGTFLHGTSISSLSPGVYGNTRVLISSFLGRSLQ